MAGRCTVRNRYLHLTLPAEGESRHPHCPPMAGGTVFKPRNTRRKNRGDTQKLVTSHKEESSKNVDQVNYQGLTRASHTRRCPRVLWYQVKGAWITCLLAYKQTTSLKLQYPLLGGQQPMSFKVGGDVTSTFLPFCSKMQRFFPQSRLR